MCSDLLSSIAISTQLFSLEVSEFRFKRFKNSLRHDFQDLHTPVVLKYRQDDMTH